MANSTPNTNAPKTPEAGTTPATTEAAAQAASATPASPEVQLRAELDQARADIQRLKDENLRVIAEARNQQQRGQRDKQDALRYAESEFARDVLVILDDFERTRESAKNATDAKSVLDGVRIVYEHFLKLLKDRHIEPIVAVGKAFDPGVHEALLKQPSEQAEGTVIQEVARGFKMHDRVLRPARVIISAGPAKSDAGKQPAVAQS